MDKKIFMKNTETIPNHYSTIDTLTLYRWDRYTSTKDNNWLLVDYDGRQKKIDCESLKLAETSIQDQYFKAVDDRSFSSKMQKWGKMDLLQTKYHIVDALLNFMWNGFGDDLKEQEQRYLIIKELQKWGFKFPELNTSVADRDLIVNFRIALEGVKTQIGLLSNELKDDGKKEQMNLYRQIAVAKTALSGYDINPRVMVVSEWIEVCKLVQEHAKKN